MSDLRAGKQFHQETETEVVEQTPLEKGASLLERMKDETEGERRKEEAAREHEARIENIRQQIAEMVGDLENRVQAAKAAQEVKDRAEGEFISATEALFALTRNEKRVATPEELQHSEDLKRNAESAGEALTEAQEKLHVSLPLTVSKEEFDRDIIGPIRNQLKEAKARFKNVSFVLNELNVDGHSMCIDFRVELAGEKLKKRKAIMRVVHRMLPGGDVVDTERTEFSTQMDPESRALAEEFVASKTRVVTPEAFVAGKGDAELQEPQG